MLHGFGADASDLYPLHQALPRNFNYIFPAGPLEIPFTPWMSGRAWFSIDFAQLEQAKRENNRSLLANRYKKDLEQTAAYLSPYLAELYQQFPQGLILGGFSQGAMVAMQLASKHAGEAWLKGLILLSGSLANETEWTNKMPNFTCPVFQSHGIHDEVLPYRFAQELSELIKKPGLLSEFHAFDGGHEIPPQIVSALGRFLTNLSL
jgi:phospholipase/carboxylesterase